jgi:hypothetical protein
MSTVKTKKVQLGTDATASNNFTIYQPSTPDGTLRIGVGNADSPTEVGRFTSAGYKPASAYLPSNQTISSATWTKVTLSSEDFDTASCFNTSTYQFTPTVAGYYSITGSVAGGVGGNLQNFFVRISKNGTAVTEFGDAYTSASLDDGFRSHTVLVYLNGSTDYMELYAYQTGGATGIYGNSNSATRLSGFLAQQA